MAIKITRKERTFSVEGKLNASTSGFFKTHFILTLNSLSDLTIDLSKVSEIDRNGINALKSIYNNAMSWEKPFYVVGHGSKEIYDELRFNLVA